MIWISSFLSEFLNLLLVFLNIYWIVKYISNYEIFISTFKSMFQYWKWILEFFLIIELKNIIWSSKLMF